MPSIHDDEFGTIKVVRSAKASHVRLRIGTDGSLRASLPLYSPMLLVKRLLRTSRAEIREMLESHRGTAVFSAGMPIGKTHSIQTRPATGNTCTATRHGNQIIVSLPDGMGIETSHVQALIRPVVIEALKKEAKCYLPKRLSYLAERHGFSYQKTRFSHASGRWGSCSSSGTISLNIALMKLPFHLIDYVLFHELSHTIQMNHSSAFWEIVERCDPDFKAHRREIKAHTPSI